MPMKIFPTREEAEAFIKESRSKPIPDGYRPWKTVEVFPMDKNEYGIMYNKNAWLYDDGLVR